MLDYLIGTANVVCLAGCVYIAYVFIVGAGAARTSARQNRMRLKLASETGEQPAAGSQLDYYYVM